MLKDREPALQHSREELELEPPKKKMAPLLMGSELESDDEVLSTDKTLGRYRTEPSVSIEACPLQWWSAHAGAHGELAQVAQRFLATPGHIVQKKRSALFLKMSTS